MNMKLAAAFFLIVGSCFAISAQARKPSSPAHAFQIKTAKDLEAVTKELEKQTGNTNKDIVPAKGGQMRVAVFHDEKREGDQYEVHDTSDDIYYVLDGKATLVLGGELVDPTEISPGEWRAETVSGGNPFEVKKGDLVVVPRGTVHQRTVSGKGFSMILIKVFATDQR
jgi:mannose-6-phosphate isomerase-like protein (cupin superfamily)